MAKEKNKNPEIKLSWLTNGEEFEIVGLEKFYRNLKLSNLTESGAYIAGFMMDKYDAIFKPIGQNYVISASTMVRRKIA